MKRQGYGRRHKPGGGGQVRAEFSHSRKAHEDIPWFYEKNLAFERLASEVAGIGRERNLSEDEFEDALPKLYEAYSGFLNAMNPGGLEGKDHRHWYNHHRDA